MTPADTYVLHQPHLQRTGRRQELLAGPMLYGLAHVGLTVAAWRSSPAAAAGLAALCAGDGAADLGGRCDTDVGFPLLAQAPAGLQQHETLPLCFDQCTHEMALCIACSECLHVYVRSSGTAVDRADLCLLPAVLLHCRAWAARVGAQAGRLPHNKAKVCLPDLTLHAALSHNAAGMSNCTG
jgi:hypothetical protein